MSAIESTQRAKTRQGTNRLKKLNPETSDAPHLSNLQSEVARKIIGFIGEGRWAVGDRISDVALARELGISRTPVRQVLQMLTRHDLIDQTQTRGFKLLRELGPDESSDAVVPPSNIENLYNELMMARASGSIGDEVSETELVEQFGATRGAVRRALMRFSAEGLAERRTGPGWRFAEFLDNKQAVNESYAFRVIIECSAMLEPDFMLNRDQLAALQQEQQALLSMPLSQITGSAWFEANAKFHETITSWSQNRFLVQAIRRQNSLRRMTEYTEFTQLSEDSVRKAARDHLGILDAILNGDNKFAAALLHRHLSRTKTETAEKHSLD